MRLTPERVSLAQARQLRADGVTRPPASLGTGPAGGYSPSDLATAYGVNPATPTTQTVAIVDAYDDPSVLGDLDSFDANYGLPGETPSSFAVVNQSGNSSPLPVSDVGWAGEITLDVETVRGLCHACKILLVETNSDSGADLAAGVDEAVSLGATIVSNSYGGPEHSGDPDTAAYNHPGVAILASAGDDGWYGWDFASYLGYSSDSAPQVPASYDTVVGVGGTSLSVSSTTGTRTSETVWNDDGPEDQETLGTGSVLGATGGGCSSIYAAQPWEQAVAGYTSLGCGGTLRSGVDIAADADEFTGYDTYETTTSWCPSGSTDGNANACPSQDPGWETYGGTSLASPLVAAMWALAGGPGGVAYPALTLYGHFQSDPSQLYDVTSGGNGYCDSDSATTCVAAAGNPNLFSKGLLDCRWDSSGNLLANIGQCNAGTGFDGPSGVGTPNGVAPFQPLSPTATIVPPGTIAQGVPATFSAAGSSAPFPGDSITQYRWDFGDGTAATTSSLTTTHTYSSPGTYSVTLTVADAYSSLNDGRTGQTSIDVDVGTTPAGNTLTVTVSGSGTVTSSPAGIDCGSAGSACAASFIPGTRVTLTATPAAGSKFAIWLETPGCTAVGVTTCTITLNQSTSVGAVFSAVPQPPPAPPQTLTVSAAGSGSGTITSTPAGINCGSTCSAAFSNGSQVTLTATAATGSKFTGWSGSCTGTGPCQLTLTADEDVTAAFAKQAPPKKKMSCVVPNVRHETLRRARAAIARAHCGVGKITRVRSSKKNSNHVISQSPKAGRHLRKGAKVALKVGK